MVPGQYMPTSYEHRAPFATKAAKMAERWLCIYMCSCWGFVTQVLLTLVASIRFLLFYDITRGRLPL